MCVNPGSIEKHLLSENSEKVLVNIVMDDVIKLLVLCSLK